jgi:DNA-directed RNA polymerase specialized sigma24 family protein
MADADADLVLQTQKGSPAAFEELVRNHQRMIHSLTFRMTGSPADAEDLAQETFIRALRANRRISTALRNSPPGFTASPSTPA